MQKKQLAIITGGTSGIGLTTAETLAPDYSLALIYRRDHDRAKRAAEQLKQKFPNTRFEVIACEVKDRDSARSVYKQVTERFEDTPDILINSAGDSRPSLFMMAQEEMIRETFDSHFFGPVALIRECLDAMYRKRYGRIVNMSSVATYSFIRGHSVYASAKSAIERFTESLALEVGPRGISVCALKPGLTDTPMVDRPTRENLIDPKCLATLIKFLISDFGLDMNGAVIPVKGLIYPGLDQTLSNRLKFNEK